MAGYSSREEYVVDSRVGDSCEEYAGDSEEYVGDSRVGDEYTGDSEEYVWQGTLQLKSRCGRVLFT